MPTILISSAKTQTIYKKSTGAILVTSSEVGIAVNAEKTKCMVMSCEQNAGQIHDIKEVNVSFP